MQDKCKELAVTVKILLRLNHRQTSVDRGISQNNAVLAQKLDEESIRSKYLVKVGLSSSKEIAI